MTNGGFDTDTAWTKGTGWTIGSGVATHATGASSNISQSITNVSGKNHTVSVDITAIAIAGWGVSLRKDGDTISTFTNDGSTTGTLTGNFVATSGTTTIDVTQGSSGEVSIDNLLIYEADPSDDAPWLRLPYGYKVGKRGMIVRDGVVLHPSDYTEITDSGQTFIKPIVAPGVSTEFSIWAGA